GGRLAHDKDLRASRLPPVQTTLAPDHTLHVESDTSLWRGIGPPDSKAAWTRRRAGLRASAELPLRFVRDTQGPCRLETSYRGRDERPQRPLASGLNVRRTR